MLKPYTKAEMKASDAELGLLYQARSVALSRLDSAEQVLHRAAGDKLHGYQPYQYWGLTDAEARERIASGNPTGRYITEAPAILVKYDETKAAWEEAHQTVIDHDATHWAVRGQWLRFFLVPGGHIHRNTRCSSLRITTQIGWLPDLSGETEVEAVTAHGALLCTKCFPDAPVEWTRGLDVEVDPAICTNKRKLVPVAEGRYPRYRECAECGYVGAITSTGALRKHKRPV